MNYNKSKRSLEKASGILGIISSSFTVFYAVAIVFIGFLLNFNTSQLTETTYSDTYYADTYYSATSNFENFIGILYILLGICILIFAICGIIFSSKVIPSPLQKDGTLKNRKGVRITMLIFMILTGNWISAGLMIAVLCSKDFMPSKEPAVTPKEKPTEPLISKHILDNNKTEKRIENKDDYIHNIEELKRLKKDGIIDEETYKRALEKIITKIANDE